MLGRIAAPDERDNEYLMTDVLPKRLPIRKTRSWYANGAWYNQGNSSSCVGHGWAHYIEDGPITHKGKVIDPFEVYTEAQKVDEWEGENYEGTSVRAGAKVLQANGSIKEYKWAFDLQTALEYVLEFGPVVLGIWWYTGMFEPDSKNVIKISGIKEGGHAVLWNGANKKRRKARIKNSWGNGKILPKKNNWGKDGHAEIDFDELDALIKDEGEACIAIENK